MIQSAINQALATGALAIGGAKHISEEAEANRLKKGEIGVKSAEAQEEVAGLEAEATKLSSELKLLGENKIPQGEEGQYIYNVFNQDLAPDIEKRKLALKTAQSKIEAKKIQIEAYQKIIGGKK